VRALHEPAVLLHIDLTLQDQRGTAAEQRVVNVVGP
jgi:hypothetical protein